LGFRLQVLSITAFLKNFSLLIIDITFLQQSGCAHEISYKRHLEKQMLLYFVKLATLFSVFETP
jgi:hypothetical protein